MIKRKEGRIVCIGSVQGKFAIPYRSSYAASKHALQAFCDSLRAEMAAYNVKVTLISPGYINTDLSKNALVGTGDTYGGKLNWRSHRPSSVLTLGSFSDRCGHRNRREPRQNVEKHSTRNYARLKGQYSVVPCPKMRLLPAGDVARGLLLDNDAAGG